MIGVNWHWIALDSHDGSVETGLPISRAEEIVANTYWRGFRAIPGSTLLDFSTLQTASRTTMNIYGPVVADEMEKASARVGGWPSKSFTEFFSFFRL